MTHKSILIIHTGGTIGMVQSEAGYVPKIGVMEEEIEKQIAARPEEISYEIVRLDPLIDSANATPRDWNRISGQIMAFYSEYDGFIVTHGTDTMAFCAAALCMSLEGLDKPIVLTGAMLPLSEPGSDGSPNLADTIESVLTAEPGVWIQFSGRLLHGARTRKIHSRDNDAFSAQPSQVPPRRISGTVLRHVFGQKEVAVVTVVPGGSMEVIEFAMSKCDGVVLRCYGSGTVPNHPTLERALAAAKRRNIPVVVVSECLGGGTSLGSYEAGAVLVRYGVIDGRDMTMEAAYAKLALALNTRMSRATQRDFILAPICGEFSTYLAA
ncbi:asparaginase [Aestuariibius sp. HNIBRBA575]|uniref:asparaginase n=1 Tax=Aestuariibius sp. HNIBRBA575 TaxID=3233343 RepID=UPI0034A1222E